MAKTTLTDCLLVAYEFPPEGGVKVHRAAKLAKYLPEFGYRPIVLTTDKRNPAQPDPSLAADLSAAVQIVRTPPCSPNTPYGALRELMDDLRAGSHPGNRPVALPARRRTRALRIAQRVMFPDLMAAWPAVARFFLPDIHDTGTPRVVWATSPPFSALIVGRDLARRMNIPLVADIRDMYCDNPHNPPPSHFAARARRLERDLLTAADAVVTVTRGIAETLDSRYALGSKLSVIYNGFDFDPHAAPLPPLPPLRIVHLGSAVRSSGRDFDSLFEAWRLLQSQQPELASNLRFTQIGILDRANRQAWEYYVRELGLQAQVELVLPLPQREAVARLDQFHLMLLHNSAAIATGGFDRTALSTKIFEYLATNRKILALGGDGEAAHLIRSHKAGWVAPYDQPEQIAATLQTVYAEAQAGKLDRPIAGDIMTYHRRNAAEQLARLFASLT